MTKKSVLVVEDDAILATHLVDILVQYGYDVQPPVATGDEAIKEAKRSEPDIILMDIRLIGEMSGITAAKKIRETMDIPVIYLTAYSDEQRLQEVMSSEPYGYLIKPVQNRELRMTIQIALYKHGIDRKLKESEERYRAV